MPSCQKLVWIQSAYILFDHWKAFSTLPPFAPSLPYPAQSFLGFTVVPAMQCLTSSHLSFLQRDPGLAVRAGRGLRMYHYQRLGLPPPEHGKGHFHNPVRNYKASRVAKKLTASPSQGTQVMWLKNVEPPSTRPNLLPDPSCPFPCQCKGR